MIEMWISILIAPALMVLAVVLHHIEATLERPARRREVAPGPPPQAIEPRPRTDRRPSPRPRASPTLP